jgi:hypothetical protein
MKINFKAKMLSALLIIFMFEGAILAFKTSLVPQTKASYDPVVIYKGLTQLSNGHKEEAPSIALDSDGNLHIVWIGNATANLYYMMVDRYGDILINETCLDPSVNASSGHVRRASIGVDSNNNVHIVFHAQNIYTPWPNYTNYTTLDQQEVVYLKINPYLDDMDGSAADYAAITVIPETIISTEDSSKSRATNLAVDHGDNVHVVWFDNDTWNMEGELHYLVMDGDGGIVVPEKNVTAGFYVDVDWGEPEIVVDSHNNAHVFFVTENWTGSTYHYRDIWYTMLDGATGNVLINNTQLTNSNGTCKHSRPFIDIDSEDMIHIAWHNSTTRPETDIFYMKINPYLDDRSGDSADPATIKVVEETLISEIDGVQSFLANIAVDKHNMAHIVWINRFYGWDYTDIYYALVNSTGNKMIPETRITYMNGTLNFQEWYWSSNRNPEIAVIDGRIFIVDMAEHQVTGYYDVWMTIAFIDKTAPSTSISYTAYSSMGKDWLSNTSAISLSAHDEESGVDAIYYRIDAGSWQTYTDPFNLATYAHGSHIIEYYGIDSFGNEEEIKSKTVYLDKTSPIIDTPTRAPSGDVDQGVLVKVFANVTDAGSGVNNNLVTLSYTFDNETTWSDTKMNYNSTSGLFEATIPKQLDGTWVKFKVSASDNVGNTAVKDNNGQYYAYMVIPEFSSIIFLAAFLMFSSATLILIKRKNRNII